MTTNSSNNFIHWNKRSGEGSKKQTISQRFLQSRNNHFTIRHRNLLPEQIQNQSSQRKTNHYFIKFKTFFTHLGGFFLANRAKIANRARPPLIPAPIEKPLPEATTTRRRISGGIITNAPPGKEGGFDGGVEWVTILSLWKPLISSGVSRRMSPESAAGAGGDMRRRRKGRNGRVKCEWKLFQKRQGNEWRWELYYFFHYEIALICDTWHIVLWFNQIKSIN